MDTLDDLKNFTDNVHQEVIQAADIEGKEALRSHAFTQYMIDELLEAGETVDGQTCFYKARGIEVNGYGIDEDTHNLDLFITIYNEVSPPASVGTTLIQTAFKRLGGFLQSALDGLHKQIEEASPVFDMALRIYEANKKISNIRFFLLTDGTARLGYKSDDEFKGRTVSFEIWDIVRLQRYVNSGRQPEPIHIDFETDYGMAIPCLAAQESGADYSAYLAILPGTVLNGIYSRYGSRLLELNVRSFLQARGKVNQGIRTTILEQPERFLAYNNGISATAHTVELVDLPQGGKGLKSVKGLQIVNGGQTTASIFYSVKNNKADVSKVFVQVKLTIINEDDLKETVPLISRYANSQNKVNEADFSVNDPFHVKMEELSRNIWAPATDGTQHQTRWFYERARGQYQDAQNRESTPARIAAFKRTHPLTQRFSKTDLAKFESTWDCYPHLVSFGAQKNFVEFTIRLKNDRFDFTPTQQFFRRHIAKAILFRKAEKIVSAQNFGGYRANIVTYSLAWLSHETNSRVDLDKIWLEQDISPTLTEAIKVVSQAVYSSITNPPGNANITEWCKKPACWERVKDLDPKIPSQLHQELVTLTIEEDETTSKKGGDKHTEEELKVIQTACNISPTIWVEVSEWGRQTGKLYPLQRNQALGLGRSLALGKKPSLKDARHGLQIIEEAQRQGYNIT